MFGRLLVAAVLFFVVLVSIGVPLAISPLTLTGVISFAPLYHIHVITTNSLILLFTATLIVWNMYRASNASREALVGVFLGGSVTLAVLAFLVASLGGAIPETSFFSLFDLHRRHSQPHVPWNVRTKYDKTAHITLISPPCILYYQPNDSTMTSL